MATTPNQIAAQTPTPQPEFTQSYLENDLEQIIELSGSLTELPKEGVSTKDLLSTVESNLIRLALNQTQGNVSQASTLLQLGRTSLIQKINKYQLGND